VQTACTDGPLLSAYWLKALVHCDKSCDLSPATRYRGFNRNAASKSRKAAITRRYTSYRSSAIFYSQHCDFSSATRYRTISRKWTLDLRELAKDWKLPIFCDISQLLFSQLTYHGWVEGGGVFCLGRGRRRKSNLSAIYRGWWGRGLLSSSDISVNWNWNWTEMIFISFTEIETKTEMICKTVTETKLKWFRTF
jgi:hypothetical protein